MKPFTWIVLGVVSLGAAGLANFELKAEKERLKSETQDMKSVVDQLRKMQSSSAKTNDVTLAPFEAPAYGGGDANLVQPAASSTFSLPPAHGDKDVNLIQRINAVETNISEVRVDLGKIGARLGVPGILSQSSSGIESFPKEVGSRLSDIEKKLPKPSQKPTDGMLLVRNKTGETQTLFVEGKEWRIPGDSQMYDIPVKLLRTDNSVITQVWPYDKPKTRQLQLVDGRYEVRFDITLVPVP